jgi:hypothetical protein
MKEGKKEGCQRKKKKKQIREGRKKGRSRKAEIYRKGGRHIQEGKTEGRKEDNGRTEGRQTGRKIKKGRKEPPATSCFSPGAA